VIVSAVLTGIVYFATEAQRQRHSPGS
jgi:hypothetical protein